MNVSQALASAQLVGGNALLNNGTLILYQGAIPATPETALSGQTALATWTFMSTAGGTPVPGSGVETSTLSFQANQVTPSASGTACFARALESGGAAVFDATVSQPWASSTAVIVGQYMTNGGNLYVCSTAGTTASSGGPTGTGTAISDGTAEWNYVASGSGDITMQSSAVSTSSPFNINSLSISLPAI